MSSVDANQPATPQDEPQSAEQSGERPAVPVQQPAAQDTPAPVGDALPPSAAAGTADGQATDTIKGRITVEDEVVEKVAALAALEVPGVADLGGDFERTLESMRDRVGIGNKRATQGVQAKVTDGGVTVDVTIVVLYGHVVMDVATAVRANVATSVSRLLGLRVVEVNVNVDVDDVQLPDQGPATPEA